MGPLLLEQRQKYEEIVQAIESADDTGAAGLAAAPAVLERLDWDGVRYQEIKLDGYSAYIISTRGRHYLNQLARGVFQDLKIFLGYDPRSDSTAYLSDITFQDGSLGRIHFLSAREFLLEPRPHRTVTYIHEARHRRFRVTDTTNPLRVEFVALKGSMEKLGSNHKIYRDFLSAEELRTFHSDLKSHIRQFTATARKKPVDNAKLVEANWNIVSSLHNLRTLSLRIGILIGTLKKFGDYNHNTTTEVIDGVQHLVGPAVGFGENLLVQVRIPDYSAVDVYKPTLMSLEKINLALRQQLADCDNALKIIERKIVYDPEYLPAIETLQTILNPRIFKLR